MLSLSKESEFRHRDDSVRSKRVARNKVQDRIVEPTDNSEPREWALVSLGDVERRIMATCHEPVQTSESNGSSD